MKRFLAFPLVRLGLIVIAFSGLLAMLVPVVGARYSIGVSIVVGWVIAALLLAVTVVVEHFTSRRSLADIGFGRRNAIRDLMLGFVLGGALFSAVVLELAAGGHYRITGVHLTRDVAIAALLLAPSAITEELLFRGVVFRLIEEWAGTWIALGVSAIIFGTVHAANPGATWVSTVAIALEAGVLLAAAYVVTRSLWLPIGLHFAWNFFEGPVYGTQISGHAFLTSAMSARVSGSSWLTGGSFGPEAGLYAVVICLLAAVAFLAYARRHSLIVRPQWARAAA